MNENELNKFKKLFQLHVRNIKGFTIGDVSYVQSLSSLNLMGSMVLMEYEWIKDEKYRYEYNFIPQIINLFINRYYINKIESWYYHPNGNDIIMFKLSS